MACAIVGSPEMKLEHAFRMVALKIAEQLSPEDCRNLAYVSGCMDDQLALPYHANFRLHVLTSLESRGLITPTKLDFLEDVLRNLGQNYLLDVIEEYKKTREYKKAIKKHKKKLTGKKQSREKVVAAIFHPSDKDQYEKLYAQFLTQFSRMSVSMRAALDSNDLVRMKLAFSNVAAGVQEVSRTMKKTVSEIDIYSSSSEESSAAASAENTQSPSPQSSSSSSEDPQSPVPCKNIAPQSEVSKPMLPVSCQPSSPSTLTKEHIFVYCHPCRIPESSKMATEDYCSSGTGTSDSGVGDIHHHTPSYKALRQLDPACRSGHDDPDNVFQRGDVPPTQGYMPLLIPQDNPADNYMKMTSPWGDPSENYMLMTYNSESMKGGNQ